MGINVSFANLQSTTSFFSGNYDVTAVVVTICCALALYNALELILLIFTTFRRYRGLYFWSLLVASFGIIPYNIGFMIEYFKLTAQLAGLVITIVGWPMMVTGQSFVLYSRLHIVLGAQYSRVLKAIYWMIIVNGIVFHFATTVVVFGAYFAAPNLHFAAAYKYIEKIQMTGFTVQELIISGLYLWKTSDILKSSPRKRTSRLMWQLLSINIIIVVMDVALLVVEFQDRHVIEQALKEVIYSIKLKLEFAILSKLVGLTRDTNQMFTAAFNDYDDFMGAERARSTYTLEEPMFPGYAPAHLKPGSIGDDKSDMSHLEKTTGFADALRLASNVSQGSRESRHSYITSGTLDEQRRRRTLDEDLYSTMMRDLT